MKFVDEKDLFRKKTKKEKEKEKKRIFLSLTIAFLIAAALTLPSFGLLSKGYFEVGKFFGKFILIFIIVFYLP